MKSGAKVYDVYSREIDPKNQMAADPTPGQLPVMGQREPLSTGRVQSTIPKGGTESTWLYPSPQMFLNALSRKKKADDVTEKDASSMVAIHNNMNERGWAAVLDWEALHCDECDPRKISLLRFVGRPTNFSPKAQIKYALGLAPRPFDRHDWVIDRCGTEVRYILDYYDATARVKDDTIPKLHDKDSVPSIQIDVRPAGDTPSQLFDRARMALRRGLITTLREELTPIETAPPEQSVTAPPPATPSARQQVKAAGAAAVAAAAANEASREADAVRASCIAEQICKPEAEAFRLFKGSTDAEGVANAYESVEACAMLWGKRTSEAASRA